MARGGDFLEPGQVSSMLAHNAAESGVNATEQGAAHTPGPWIIFDDGPALRFIIMPAMRPGEICTVGLPSDQPDAAKIADANACLIAAAPLFFDMGALTLSGAQLIAEGLKTITDNADEWTVAEVKQYAQALRTVADKIIRGNEALLSKAKGSA